MLFFVYFIYFYSLAASLALPLLNATTTSLSPSINDTFTLSVQLSATLFVLIAVFACGITGSFANSISSSEGYHYPIPGIPLTLHLTLFPKRIPLPLENTLLCLHKFAKTLSSEPQSNYLDHTRAQTTSNVEAIISPVKCLGCGLTYRESVKVLAGLWYYTSRKKLLYVQRYGVFESQGGRMVAWGTLTTPLPAPEILEGLDMASVFPQKMAETS